MALPTRQLRVTRAISICGRSIQTAPYLSLIHIFFILLLQSTLMGLLLGRYHAFLSDFKDSNVDYFCKQ